MGNAVHVPSYIEELASNSFNPNQLPQWTGTVFQGIDVPSATDRVLKAGDTMTGTLTMEKSKIEFTYETEPGAPTVALDVTAGNLTGSYNYKITFVTALGETAGGTTSLTITPSAQRASLTNIPLGSSSVTARKIYRNKATTVGQWYLVATLADNTTTTYADNIADASLVTLIPKFNTTAGIITGKVILSGGLTSPWTHLLIVDIGNKAGYTHPKDACDYVSTQAPATTNPWQILMMPGIYSVTVAFTIPVATFVTGLTPNGNSGNTNPVILDLTAVVSGTIITMNNSAGLANMIVRWNSFTAGVITAPLTMISMAPNIKISNCYLQFYTNTTQTVWVSTETSAVVYVSGTIYDIFNAGAGIQTGHEETGSSFSVFLSCKFSSNVAGHYVFIHNSTGSNGEISNSTFTGPAQIKQTAGVITLNQTTYSNYVGTITHGDRFYGTNRGVRQAASDTDIPLTAKGFSATQSADLIEILKSDATIYAKFDALGRLGLQMGATALTAFLHLAAGTAAASTAPLKFTQGTNLTTPEAGAVEWNGTNLFITQTSGPTRKTVAYTDDVVLQAQVFS